MFERGRFVTYFILLMAIVYATQASDKIAHVGSYSGEVRYDGCEKHGGSYYYCHSKKEKWDYCSPSLNVDYYGKACKTNHPCGKHGLSYYWCNNSAGSWGYCGPVERKLTRYTSSKYKKLCLDDCTKGDSSYFYCFTSTEGEWDYCSPVPNVSYQNEICNADHSCGLHGYDKYWCKIGSSWNYCGLVEREKCQGKAPWKRAGQPEAIRNCIIDRANNIEVNYIVRPSNSMSTNEIGRERRVRAHMVIARFQNGMLSPRAGTLLSNNDWRLDMQGTFIRDRLEYYNLQLQLNADRQNPRHRSTTYAAVLVPFGNFTGDAYTGQRRIRNALLTSLAERRIITIQVKPIRPHHDELRTLTALDPKFENFVRGNLKIRVV